MARSVCHINVQFVLAEDGTDRVAVRTVIVVAEHADQKESVMGEVMLGLTVKITAIARGVFAPCLVVQLRHRAKRGMIVGGQTPNLIMTLLLKISCMNLELAPLFWIFIKIVSSQVTVHIFARAEAMMVNHALCRHHRTLPALVVAALAFLR